MLSNCPVLRWSRWLLTIGVLAFLQSPAVWAESQPPLVPRIAGVWWQVAGDPDLGPWTDPGQQPVDFAVWQAADGTWQLWSCIRKTRCGGQTRLFYRWEGAELTQPNWTPTGIAMTADPELGETAGGLQAPHVIRHDDRFEMYYGDWRNICRADSTDGKSFQRVPVRDGRPQLFTEDRSAEDFTNTRDAMVLRVGDRWHCYYTAYPDRKGAVYCRTSADRRQWSASVIVAAGGKAGDSPFSAECPHVVFHAGAGYYYLFRTQRYGQNAQSLVYRSRDPLYFGVHDDSLLVASLPIAAPELIEHEGQWYVAALLPSLKGIQIARLEWQAAQE